MVILRSMKLFVLHWQLEESPSLSEEEEADIKEVAANTEAIIMVVERASMVGEAVSKVSLPILRKARHRAKPCR
ncbi:unnamed protein product [Victoria cruziana]